MDAERATIMLRPGEEAIARMPSAAERRALKLDPGVPVIEIRRRGVAIQVLPAPGVRLHAP
jgi:GntR family transcriptional regulator